MVKVFVYTDQMQILVDCFISVSIELCVLISQLLSKHMETYCSFWLKSLVFISTSKNKDGF